MRKINHYSVVGVTAGLLACGQARADTSSERQMQSEAERIVSQYKGVFTNPPTSTPSRGECDGPLLGNGNLGVVISGNPDAQRFWIGKNNFWRLRDGHRMGGPRPFGGLEVNIPALSNATYRVEQEIYQARITAEFDGGTTHVVMRSFVPATEDLLIVELSVTGAPVAVETRLWAARGRGSHEELGRKDGILWATKAFAEAVSIPTAAACALTVMGCNVSNPDLEPLPADADLPTDTPPGRVPLPPAKSQPGPMFTLRPGQKVTVVLAVRSSFDDSDPLAAVQRVICNLTADKLKDLGAKHHQWWREFWAKSLVEIGDPVLELRYYLSNYVMGCASRNPDFPPGLFGLPVTDDDPKWAGDYHLNYNHQAPFYALYAGNHIEQADTFEQPVLDYMDRGKAYAKELLNIRGVYYPVGIGAKGTETSMRPGRDGSGYEKGGCFLGQKSNAAYCLVNMSMRWYATYDVSYALKVYPFVLEVANFWEDYLKFENGHYVIHDDSTYENMSPVMDFNPIVSLGLVRNTFELVTELSNALGVDKDQHDKWQHILQNLSQFPTFEKDGVTVFRLSEKGNEWNDGSVGIEHIYPAGAIDQNSDPKLVEIGLNTIRAMSWWNHNGSTTGFYPAAVRVGFNPATILEKLKEMIATYHLPNGFVCCLEDSSTVPNTINEMLCTGHHDVMRVFPAWPRNNDARFLNLREWGAFLVSSELKGGIVKYVKIHSEKGRPCNLVNPWPGKAIDVYRDGKKVDTLKGERVVLKTEAGSTLVLGQKGTEVPAAP